MQKTFYMEAIIKGNKLGHKMLTGMKEMKYTRSSFTPACMCMLRAGTGGRVRHSPQKCKRILLTASASQHSALQILWEVSGDIKALPSSLTSLFSLTMPSSDLLISSQIVPHSTLPDTHRSTNPCTLGVFSSSQERASCQKELA